MYFDSSLGREGVLASPDILAATGIQCISFDVNMYSSNVLNMGNLTIYFFQQTFENNRNFVEEIVWQSKPNLTPTSTSWYKVNFDLFNIDNRNVYKVSRRIVNWKTKNIISSVYSLYICIRDHLHTLYARANDFETSNYFFSKMIFSKPKVFYLIGKSFFFALFLH